MSRVIDLRGMHIMRPDGSFVFQPPVMDAEDDVESPPSSEEEEEEQNEEEEELMQPRRRVESASGQRKESDEEASCNDEEEEDAAAEADEDEAERDAAEEEPDDGGDAKEVDAEEIDQTNEDDHDDEEEEEEEEEEEAAPQSKIDSKTPAAPALSAADVSALFSRIAQLEKQQQATKSESSKSLKIITAQLSASESSLQSLQSKVAQIPKRSPMELAAMLQAFDRKIDSLQKSAVQSDQSMQSLQRKVSVIPQSKPMEVAATMQACNDKIDGLQREIKLIKAGRTVDLDDVRSSIAAIKSKLNRKLSELESRLQGQIDEIEERLGDLEADQDQSDDESSDDDSSSDDGLEERVCELECQVDASCGEMQDLLVNLGEIRATLEKEQRQRGSESAQQQGAIADLTARLADSELQARIQKQMASVQTPVSVRANREAQLMEQLQQQLAAHAAEIASMHQEQTTQILALLASVSRYPESRRSEELQAEVGSEYLFPSRCAAYSRVQGENQVPSTADERKSNAAAKQSASPFFQRVYAPAILGPHVAARISTVLPPLSATPVQQRQPQQMQRLVERQQQLQRQQPTMQAAAQEARGSVSFAPFSSRDCSRVSPVYPNPRPLRVQPQAVQQVCPAVPAPAILSAKSQSSDQAQGKFVYAVPAAPLSIVSSVRGRHSLMDDSWRAGHRFEKYDFNLRPLDEIERDDSSSSDSSYRKEEADERGSKAEMQTAQLRKSNEQIGAVFQNQIAAEQERIHRQLDSEKAQLIGEITQPVRRVEATKSASKQAGAQAEDSAAVAQPCVSMLRRGPFGAWVAATHIPAGTVIGVYNGPVKSIISAESKASEQTKQTDGTFVVAAPAPAADSPPPSPAGSSPVFIDDESELEPDFSLQSSVRVDGEEPAGAEF